MEQPKVKLPQKGGAEKAAQIFENTRKKEPSDRLVKIISEIPAPEVDRPQNDDRAAKEVEV